MPLGYGSQIQLPSLSLAELATTAAESSSSLTTFLRVLITIGEIAIGFTGIGAIAETGVGVGAGAINEILDIREGNSSATGAFLNFGTPFIGGAFSGGRNLSQGLRAEGNIADLGQRAIGISNKMHGTGQTIAGLPVFKLDSKGTNFLDRLGSLGNRIGQNPTSKLSLFNKGTRNVGRGFANIDPLAAKMVAKNSSLLGRAAGFSLKEGDNLVREIGEDKRFTDFLETSGLSSAKQLELLSLLRGAKDLTEARSMILGFVRDLGARDALRLFRNVTGEIERVALTEAWHLPYARQIMHEFDEFAAKNLNEEFLKQEVPSMWKRIVKKVGSSWFNKKVVQRLQWIDPNDLGRAGVEETYQLVKKQIRKYFKAFKKVENLEDAFVKGGGTMVDSDWHMGYKVIKDLGVNKQMVQITYGKDTGRYRHVIVFATDSELESYIRRPGEFYRQNWAYSRGGKALGLEAMFSLTGIKSLGFQAASILGFINVQALKNVLSLVSNYVENGADIANGSYSNSYIKKFTNSFRNSLISRSFRLLGKEIFGGFATKFGIEKFGEKLGKSIGDFIGRESQRVGTQIFATGIKNVIAGQDFSKGLGKKAIEGGLISIRSNSLRNLRRRRPLSVTVQTLSARRKLQQIKRIPNAVVPGRPFQGIKF